jgi:hypothetical protein
MAAGPSRALPSRLHARSPAGLRAPLPAPSPGATRPPRRPRVSSLDRPPWRCACRRDGTANFITEILLRMGSAPGRLSAATGRTSRRSRPDTFEMADHSSSWAHTAGCCCISPTRRIRTPRRKNWGHMNSERTRIEGKRPPASNSVRKDRQGMCRHSRRLRTCPCKTVRSFQP